MTNSKTRACLVGALSVAAIITTSASAAERKVGQRPEPGVDAVVTVGSPLLERFNMVAVNVPKLRDDLKMSLGIQGKIVIPAGATFRVEKASPLKACTVAQDTYVDHFVGPRGAACLYDNDMDGTFDQGSAESVLLTKRKVKAPVPYDMIDTPASGGSDNFRHTLIYLGSGGGVIRLSYREFSQDMARPAFTEELSFPVGPAFPQGVVWRDTKITLLGLDNSGLRYRIEPAAQSAALPSK